MGFALSFDDKGKDDVGLAVSNCQDVSKTQEFEYFRSLARNDQLDSFAFLKLEQYGLVYLGSTETVIDTPPPRSFAVGFTGDRYAQSVVENPTVTITSRMSRRTMEIVNPQCSLGHVLTNWAEALRTACGRITANNDFLQNCDLYIFDEKSRTLTRPLSGLHCYLTKFDSDLYPTSQQVRISFTLHVAYYRPGAKPSNLLQKPLASVEPKWALTF